MVEVDDDVREGGPILELPLHDDLLVLLEGDELGLDGVAEHLQLTAGGRLTNCGTLSELANGHLCGEGVVNDGGGHVVMHVDFGLLGHLNT